eukprot:2678696-Rhodomonas_salina.1
MRPTKQAHAAAKGPDIRRLPLEYGPERRIDNSQCAYSFKTGERYGAYYWKTAGLYGYAALTAGIRSRTANWRSSFAAPP